MARYRRYRKGSTGIVKMRFQSFMDIQTSNTSMQVITISAGGKNILQRLAPQFAAYKYYKIGSVSIRLIPATTLPVDPTGLSINAGGAGVDPRDQVSPGLIRITNGEDVLEDISGLSETEQRGIYQAMMLDPRWFKWMLQSGVKRWASPRYWQIGQLHQDKWPGMDINIPQYQSGVRQIEDTAHAMLYRDVDGNTTFASDPGNSSAKGIFQIGHSGRLGWLPTDGLHNSWDGQAFVNTPFMASPPEVEVMKLILPRAYLTKYWYRIIVTETVLFREPIVTLGAGAYRPLDIFHYSNLPAPAQPSVANAGLVPTDRYTGGNYGDD